MKQISIKIEDQQYEELQKICASLKIKNVSWLIRRSIDLYLITQGKEVDA